MEKNVILTASTKSVITTTAQSSSALKSSLSITEALAQTAVVRNIAELFSIIMEEEVTPQHSLLILNAMFALFFLIFPVYSSIILRTVSLVWFAVSLIQCKKAGLDKE